MSTVDLDLAVWELRRYCQVLNVFGKKLIPVEQQMLDFALEELRLSSSNPRHTFRIPGGYLEEILAKPKHPARDGLVWHNPCYGVRNRKTVKVRNVMQGSTHRYTCSLTCWTSCSSTCSFRRDTSMFGGNTCECCAPTRQNDHRPPQKVAGLKQLTAETAWPRPSL